MIRHLAPVLAIVGAASALAAQEWPWYTQGDFVPERRVAENQGNHTFSVTPRADGSFEYLIAGAWSEGAVVNTWGEFEAYVLKTARRYESPVRVRALGVERR